MVGKGAVIQFFLLVVFGIVGGYVGGWVVWFLFGRVQVLMGVSFPYAAIYAAPTLYQIAWTTLGAILFGLIGAGGIVEDHERSRNRVIRPRLKSAIPVKDFSIEEEEQHFLEIANRRKALQISEDQAARGATKIIQRFRVFVQACNSELTILARKSANPRTNDRIRKTTERRDLARQTLNRLETKLERWRDESSRSYIA